MSSAAEKVLLTAEQYLAIERKSEVKHEFYRGEMFAMAGASRAHNLIAFNFAVALGNQLADRPCEAYVGDMRVRIESTGLYTYPDIVVVCGEPKFLDGESDTLLNPTLIVEVLSPATENYDRSRKFAHYRSIPSLREYITIAQDRVWVERHVKRDGEWSLWRTSSAARSPSRSNRSP